MKIRIKFSKQGHMRFIGHLDIMRYFQKAMRRAEVDIRYSEGFSPHQIMSFAAPLGVGLTSDGEYMDIEVLSCETSEKMKNRLNSVMAEGMEILSFRRLPDNAANAMSLVAACDYTVRFSENGKPPAGNTEEDFFRKLEEFIRHGNLEVTKKTKKGEKQMDLKPGIYEARTEKGQDGTLSFFLKVSSGSTLNIKPEQVLEAFYHSMGMEYPMFDFRITRKEIYGETDPGASAEKRFRTLESFGEEIE